MPWKKSNVQWQRFELVKQMQLGKETVFRLCRRWRISRKTAYKWRQRLRSGQLAGLLDRSHRPAKMVHQISRRWVERLRRMRSSHRTWGARKLRHRLGEQFGWEGLPSVATMGRWLKRLGLVKWKRRRRAGPMVRRPPVRAPDQSNEVWTVDFKGWYKTGDGTKVEPLTVRDLYSRYGLAVILLRDQRIAGVKKQFVKIFRKHGLPQRIRSDNGSPFGGAGPTGLTRLSAWWITLGIEVEFITPGRPCENGAHEQFHRVYKGEVARQPARRVRGQQRRSNRWLDHYNYQRPHEALGMAVPASLYRQSSRRLPEEKPGWNYPAGWTRRWVKGSGEITWEGQRYFVGEAFGQTYVGLKPVGKRRWRVYFGPILIGTWHEEEGSIRPAQYRRKKPLG